MAATPVRASYAYTVTDTEGRPIAGASITVYQVGTTTEITETIYADATGASELDNPFTADSLGQFRFYLDKSKRVDLKVSATGYPTPYTLQDVDVVRTGESPTTIVVAASDAPDWQKLGAHYVCDGTADQEEFQAALDAGGPLELTRGAYTVTAVTTVASDREIIMHAGTVINTASACNIFENADQTNGNSNIHIHGGKLVGDGTNALRGIYILGASGKECLDIVIENVKATGFKNASNGYGILLDYCDDPKVDGCRAWDCNFGIWFSHCTGGGGSLSVGHNCVNFGIVIGHSCEDVKLLGCDGHHCVTGIEITYSAIRCHAIGCNGYSNTDHGLMIWGANENSVVGGAYHDNTKKGIHVASRSGEGTGEGNTIGLAQVYNNGEEGINLQTWHNVVGLNMIHDNGAYGIDIAANGGNIIMPNMMEGNSSGEINDQTNNNIILYNRGFTANAGTANTGVTAVEHSDGYKFTTVLTVSQVNALTLADNASIADGYLLYTFPAGTVVIDYAYMTMAVQAAGSELPADTPDVGLGTVIASGAVATLDGTGTFEDIITGQTAADADGTATVKTALPTAAVPFVIESGDAHTLHFNVADAWADDTGGDLTADIAGTVVIVWRFLA